LPQVRHSGDIVSALLLSCAPKRITITIQTGGPPTLSGGVATHCSRSCPGEVKAWASAGWGCRNGHPRGRGLDPPVGAGGTDWRGGPSDLGIPCELPRRRFRRPVPGLGLLSGAGNADEYGRGLVVVTQAAQALGTREETDGGRTFCARIALSG